MRILLVQPAVAPEKGGAQGVHAALAVRLAKHGHDVHLVGEYERVPALWARLSASEVTVHQRRLHGGGIGGARWLRGVLRSVRPDIVQSALRPADVATALARIGLGVPHVVLVQERLPTATDEAAPSRMKSLVHRLALRRADAVTGTSEFAREAVARFARLDRAHTGVIPNGIDLQRFTESTVPPAAIEGVPEGAPVVLVVGRLSPEKRPLLAIEVAERLASLLPEARVVFAGDGPMRPDVEAAIAASRARDHIVLLGARSDVPALYRRAAVLLHLCAVEGFGLTPLEAMASGVPVVATGAGGVADIVRDGVTGVLVPVEAAEAEQLATQLASLLADGPRRQRMGAAGREAALGYSEEAMAERYEALYARLLATRSGA